MFAHSQCSPAKLAVLQNKVCVMKKQVIKWKYVIIMCNIMTVHLKWHKYLHSTSETLALVNIVT